MSERSSEQIRYRVTGGVFLGALAIIFLPMLFDGEGVQPVTLEPMRAPAPEVAPIRRLSEVAPESNFVEEAAELRDAVSEDGFHRDTQTRIGEAVLSVPGAQTSAWAVQVASFSSPDNARAFRDRLRDDGYEAFLSSHRPGSSAVITRVAVGPFLDEAEAEALQDELANRYETDARLMGFGT